MTEHIGLKMLHDQVLVKPDKESESVSGIHIPDSAKNKPTEGVVCAVGPGAVNSDGKVVPLTVKSGDRVVYRKWAGNEIKRRDIEYMVMKESDIIAILEDK